MYFFGCWNGHVGHYLHDENGTRLYSRDHLLLPDRLDGLWAPGAKGRRYPQSTQPQDETQVALHHVDGWTLLAMWDRSVDTRAGSNAVFIARGQRTADEMWAEALRAFPTIVPRLRAWQHRTQAAPAGEAR
jgi:hypothetical protein